MKHGIGRAGLVFRLMVFVALFSGLIFQTGCATQAMKGTPFYTGEWTEREGNVEDRVALWPLAYYRKPALSVLWPIFEKSPDHLAIRPLYTVRGLERHHPVHHVLWPFGRFDFQRDQYYFFPIFSGKNHFVLFPLYWHFDDPFLGEDGSNALFPLWIYDKASRKNEASRHILHLAWPLARFAYGPNVSAGRVFPLYATRTYEGKRQYFISLPFGWSREGKDGEKYGWLFPLYVYSKDVDRSLLITPIYQHGSAGADDKKWNMIFPLYYRWSASSGFGFYTLLGGGSRQNSGASTFTSPLYMRKKDGDGYGFDAVPPLLSWRSRKPAVTNWHVLGPLGRLSQGEGRSASYLFPLVYSDAASGTLLTPFFQKGGREGEAVWHSVIPLYLRRTSPESSAWITPLGAVTRYADGRHRTITPLYVHLDEGDDTSFFAIPPLLSWQLRDDAIRDYWFALGLGRFGLGENQLPSHLIPIYYRNPEKNTTLTPLWSTWTKGSEKWKAVPPLLSWQHIDARSNRTTRVMAGLYGHTRTPDDELSQSHLVPLYAYKRNQYFYTPLLGQDAPEDGKFRYWFTPLIGSYRNRFAGSWVWPFYTYQRNRKTGHQNASFLLWGYHKKGETYSRSGFFPVFSRSKQEREPWALQEDETDQNREYIYRQLQHDVLSLLLLYRHRYEVTQYGPRNGPVVEGTRYLQRELETNRFFPLWQYRKETFGQHSGPVKKEASILWRLYDYQQEVGTEDQPHDYVRHRILWRVWHYEKLQGQVSIDSVPFITYDSKPNGFRKFSFFWRAIRYESDPERGKKIDFLFIPFWRGVT